MILLNKNRTKISLGLLITALLAITASSPIQSMGLLKTLGLVKAGAQSAQQVDGQTKNHYTYGIEQAPLVLDNSDLNSNSLRESVYELLNQAQSSILLLSFTFSDSEVIRIINKKAQAGVSVQLIIDRDHFAGSQGKLDSSIKVDTRKLGEGHLHHKILVIDRAYVWVGSANFTSNAFNNSKNMAIGFFSPAIGAQLHQEALDIAVGTPRAAGTIFSCVYPNSSDQNNLSQDKLAQNQQLELYILPHNAPEAPQPVEAASNEQGKQKLISLIDNAQHHIKISIDVWTYKDVSRALINAARRGVQIDVVVGDMAGEAVSMALQAGIQVKQGTNLHYKFMLVDHAILLNGSPNWSMNAFSRSDESFTVLYGLTQVQLQALESSLKTAGLPIAMHVNNKAGDANNGPSAQEVGARVELINQTIAKINTEIGKVSTGQERQRLTSIAKRLVADLAKHIPNAQLVPVPGCCLYAGDDYLAQVVAIAEKQERVQDAVNYIKRIGNVDQQVCDYFENALKKLQAGINLALPAYFHAAQAEFNTIITSKQISQSSVGPAGLGTYISWNNQENQGEGWYAFALDEGALADTTAVFHTGWHPVTNVLNILWVSVLKDISIAPETVAFIDVSANDVARVKALLQQLNLGIEVMDRKKSQDILRIFDMTTKRRELPSFGWSKSQAMDYLPQNVFTRSVQGTFRQFTFGL